MHEELVKREEKEFLEEELGFILWKVQTIEDFLPAIEAL